MIAPIVAMLTEVDRWDGHMGWDGGGWWMVMFGTLMMAGFVVLVVWLVRTTPGTGGGGQRLGEDPLASARRILAERYARGELSAEEYHERVGHLE